MKKLSILFMILTLFLMLVGCTEDEDNPDYEERIAVYAYLYVNEPVSHATIMITKTLPIDEFYNIEDATVEANVLLEEVETGNQWTFVKFPSDTIPYFINNDSISIIQENTTYELTILTDDGKTITAQTITPFPMEMLNSPPSIPEGIPVEEYENYGISYTETPDNPFIFTCSSDEQFGMVDAYCEEEWYDARYINDFGGHDRPDDQSEYDGSDEGNGGGAGEPRHIMGWSKLKDLDKRPDLGENVYEIDWYGGMIMFYGNYTLTILTMDDNYHNFIYKEHSELYGGINGGIGVFGSANRYRYNLYITE